MGRARADFVDYSYHWSVSPGAVFVGTNPTSGNAGDLSTGSVAFSVASDGSGAARVGGGPSAIPVGQFTTTSSAPEEGPDSFSSPFTLALRLTDAASGERKDLTFSGTINGKLTAAASTLTVDFTGPRTQRVTLGGLDYAASMDLSTASIPAPGEAGASTLGATIQVGPRSDPTPPVSQAPEPSTLLLAAFALPLAALARRRANRPAQVIDRDRVSS
jgi:hypothetical protein